MGLIKIYLDFICAGTFCGGRLWKDRGFVILDLYKKNRRVVYSAIFYLKSILIITILC